jgi:hypothetical protein
VWADAVLPADGTARVATTEALEEALDDLAVERLVLDLGAADDPAGLLKHVAAFGDLELDLMVLVDDRWPTSVRSLPRLPWAGVVAGHQGDWTARLLAAVLEKDGDR